MILNKPPISNDIPRYRKKSTSKGLPRSKHKHENIFVKLTGFVDYGECLGRVCKVCGRIADVYLFGFIPKDFNDDYDSLPIYTSDKKWGKVAFQKEEK